MFRSRSRTIALASCLLLPLAACAPETETEEIPPAAQEMEAPAEQVPAELASTSEAYLAAWNAEDAAAVAAFFTEDAVVKLGEETYTGRQAIETEWVQPVLGSLSGLEVTDEISERRGDTWFAAGTYRHQTTEEGAEPRTDTGRYATTWTQTADGQWRIISEEIIPDAPATPAPQN